MFINALKALFGRKEEPAGLPKPKPLELLNRYAVDPQFPVDYSLSMRLSDDQAKRALAMHQPNPWLRLVQRKLAEHGMGGQVDPRILLFIVIDLDRPAIAMLWAYTLYRLAERRLNPEGLMFGEFIEAFPDGLPSPEGYRQAWLAQRGPKSNLLDEPGQWQ